LNSVDFLARGGETGGRLREQDWRGSSLGEPETWPTTLKTLIRVILDSDQPMLIAWGPDLVAIYNDALAAVIGRRHPGTLGQPLFEVWADIAERMRPRFERALGGAPNSFDYEFVRVDASGAKTQTILRGSYTPIRDGAAVLGVLSLATDVTASALAERRNATLIELTERLENRGDARSIVEISVGVLGRRLGAQRVGYGEVREDDETILIESSYVDGVPPLHGRFALNGFGAETIAEHRRGRIVSHDDVLATGLDPAIWRAIETRSFASAPLIRDGALRATLFADFRDPHVWSPFELELMRDVATRVWEALERVRAEAALRESERRLAFSEKSLRLATEAAEIGIWDLDIETGVLTWSARTKAMFGISPDARCAMDDFYAGLHPEDRAATAEAFASALDPERRLGYDVEYRTVGKEDGIVRWVAAKGLGLFDDAGRCVRALGTAIDITARKRLDEKLARQTEELERARESLSAIFNASSEGLTLCRLIRGEGGSVVDYQVLDVNPAHQRLTGATRDQMLAKPVSQIAPPISPRWMASAERATRTGEPQSFEVRSPVTGRWLEIHVSPVSEDLIAQTFIDVTGWREAEAQRLRLIAEMNHRVKNNFQMVASVLNLQARRTNSEEARAQLGAARRRIGVLAELHDSLAMTPDVGQIEFREYLHVLCDKLRASIDDPERVRLVVCADAASFDSAVVVALGFVVNELVTNAIKHAFPPPGAGVIKVAFHAETAHWRLVVADEGRGMPAAEVGSTGLGMRLVRSFASQVGAELEVSAGAGLAYSIRIPRKAGG
jgi:PAS domain S-box-containing protein